MKAREVGTHMVMDPHVCFGKLTFKGTRLPVQAVLSVLSQGESIPSILECWPYLTRDMVLEAISAASDALTRQFPARKARHHVHSRRAPRVQRPQKPVAKTA
jgi:uncharacterized protein (DUF433 family)